MSEQPHDTEPVTIVLATRNQGKVRELAEPLRAFGLRVVGLDAFPDLPEVEETGTTFEENALLKAREVSKRPKAKPSSPPAPGKAASPAPRAAKTASATIPFSSIPSWASPPPKCPRKKK